MCRAGGLAEVMRPTESQSSSEEGSRGELAIPPNSFFVVVVSDKIQTAFYAFFSLTELTMAWRRYFNPRKEVFSITTTPSPFGKGLQSDVDMDVDVDREEPAGACASLLPPPPPQKAYLRQGYGHYPKKRGSLPLSSLSEQRHAKLHICLRKQSTQQVHSQRRTLFCLSLNFCKVAFSKRAWEKQ